MGRRWLRPFAWHYGVASLSNLKSSMLIVMAIETEQLPVTAVRWIIVMVVVLMMDRELPQIFAAKFATTTCAYLWVQL
jgi:hypothetical protein